MTDDAASRGDVADDREAEASRGGPHTAEQAVDHEVAMARAVIPFGMAVAVIAAGAALVARGPAAGATALGAALFVVGVFVLTGYAHAWAARRGLGVLRAVALGGMLARLVVYALLLVVLRPVAAVDDIAVVAGGVVAIVAVLAFEVRFVSRHPELYWVDATRRADPAVTTKERA